MNLPQLKDQLKRKSVEPFYIFFGPDTAIMDIYIQKIAITLGAAATRLDSVSAIYSKLQNKSIMKSRACYVVRDDKEYLQQERIWESMIRGKAQGDNVVILVYTSMDKRGKFYKRHSDMMTEFEPMSDAVLAKHVKKEIGLSEGLGAKLAAMCSCDYGRTMLECDKLLHYCNATGMATDDAFKQAVKSGLIYTPPSDAIFELIDAVCTRQERTSFFLWLQLQERKESPLAVLSLLYSNFRAMLLVDSAGNEKGITERTGLTSWQVKLAKEKLGHYSASELVRSVRLLREVEKGIKTGTVPAELAVDFALVQILR